ncbi:MAG: YfhO family protein [Desulfobacterales bacterium]|nr:YfhO family protein [Desulfobacterales bacterium]
MKKITWKHTAPPLAGALLVLLFFHPVLLGSKTFFFRDIHRFFYPMKYFLSQSFHSGQIPFWNPGIFCGSPFMSNMQSGVFYPPSILFFLLPFPVSLNLYILLHFFLAFIFFHLFIRSHGLSSGAAIIGAIAYAYGGYTISSVNTLNNLSATVWLPAVLWAHQMTVKRHFIHGYCLVVVFLALSILGGEPQIFAMGAGLLLLSALVAGSAVGPGQAVRQGFFAVGLCLTAVAATMVQIGPTWTDYQFSARAGGIAFDEAARHSLNIKSIGHFLFPLHFSKDFVTSPDSLTRFFPDGSLPWLLTVYSGLLALPLAVAGIFMGPAPRRRWRMMWAAIFGVGLLLSLGRHTPVFFLFYKLFPVFRFPEKFIFLCSFALAVLSAEGVEVLRKTLARTQVRPWLVIGALAAAMTADLFTHHRYLNPVWDAAIYSHQHPLMTPIKEDRELFRVYIDGQNLPPARGPETILGSHARWQAFSMPNLGMTHRFDHVGGKTGLELRHQYLITELLARPWAEKLLFLKMANVRYIVSAAPLDREPALAGQVTRINPLVFRLDTALPRAWVVGDLLPVKTGQLDDLTRAVFDPAVTALAPAALAGQYHRLDLSGVKSIRYDRPNRIHIVVDTPETAVLVLSESAYPGWRVWVDGQERPCLRLNLLFQGVALETGRHEVTFSFRPKGFSVFAGSSATVLAMVGLIWFFLARRAKQSYSKI